MSELKKLISFIKPHKLLIVVSIITTLVIGVLEPLIVYLLNNVINSGLHDQQHVLMQNIAFFLAIISMGVVIKYAIKLTTTRFSALTLRDIRNKVSTHILDLPISVIDKYTTGDLISRMTNDIAILQRYFTNYFNATLYAPIVLGCAVSLMLLINWKLIIISLVLLPFGIYLSNLLAKSLGEEMGTLQHKLGNINSIAQNSIQGIHTLKSFNLMRPLYYKYSLEANQMLLSSKIIEKKRAVLISFSILMRFGPESICILYGGYLMLHGQIDSGGLLAYIFLLQFAAFPLSIIPGLIGNYREMLAACTRIFEILDLPKENSTYAAPPSYDHNADPVQFENVSFCYTDSDKCLHNLNFSIPSGKIVAIVGPSGSGKSTIFKLICGFHDIHEGSGSIKIFGKDLKEWNLPDLRSCIGLVSQDSYLFPESIVENIKYGNIDASIEEIIIAAQSANAHSFITTLSEGYQTIVGERGNKLSGGQRQRIALARALLKNAPILLLDEATSALDTQSESLIQEALAQDMSGRTVIIIAHRLSAIKYADEILVLDRGRIIERGNHEYLLCQDGLYKKLYLNEFNEVPEKSIILETGLLTHD
ncbi:ABC transporter ATP-binding protein [Paenibacillus sediminis]|uniref:Subfamily B ATP-binding cassette protein MsbA/ATP-binding cassette subfamily B protein AbcA/BmrA n=1 Tax=Paenibacillus sediminis TaxID=664909 RepID=A0ABS4GYK5_9BACL|nr:ABC transporter ATP-binding protein [Paenibacillus sediminis]MBP1935360.1 subfamily B ATP-binding cassette protein MsbA/ATP-binding cassette subfamily B protein AbcA/BmrA [Paenibacillus sediminis]